MILIFSRTSTPEDFSVFTFEEDWATVEHILHTSSPLSGHIVNCEILSTNYSVSRNTYSSSCSFTTSLLPVTAALAMSIVKQSAALKCLLTIHKYKPWQTKLNTARHSKPI